MALLFVRICVKVPPKQCLETLHRMLRSHNQKRPLPRHLLRSDLCFSQVRLQMRVCGLADPFKFFRADTWS